MRALRVCALNSMIYCSLVLTHLGMHGAKIQSSAWIVAHSEVIYQ